MNKQACLERFQQLKQDYKYYFVEKEEEKLLVYKYDEKSLIQYEVRYLEKETACFLELEPSLDGNVLTRFSYDGAEGKMIYTHLTLDIEGYVVELVANACEFQKKGIRFHVNVHSELDQVFITLSANDIPSSLKQTLRRVYAHFKETVITSPMFRLYLATGEVKIIEEDVVNKIGENA